MDESTEIVYASDDEEDTLRVRDLIEEQRIPCTVSMRSDNYLFGPGVLNEGAPLLGGKYAISVASVDVEKALSTISGNDFDKTDVQKETPEQHTYTAPSEPAPGETDNKHFTRAILFGLIHLAGFGTVFALVSASRIRKLNRTKRTLGFVVPIVWYSTLLLGCLSVSYSFGSMLIAINMIALGTYLIFTKRKALYISIVLLGIAVFVCAAVWLPYDIGIGLLHF